MEQNSGIAPSAGLPVDAGYEPAAKQRLLQAFWNSLELMHALRSLCPWDRSMDAAGLKRYLLEECYEVLDAIDSQQKEPLREELGDLFFQILFQVEIQRERQTFTLAEVLEDLVEKMVRRHPHVFSKGSAGLDLTAKMVASRWEEIKQNEKSGSTFAHFLHSLPALLGAYKIGRKCGQTGFDWPDPVQVLEKVREELAEVEQAMAEQDAAHLQEELGDLLFVVANLVRKCAFEPEETLRQANKKFIRRYEAMEQLAAARGEAFHTLPLERQEAYWAEVKRRQATGKT
jgi:MazG family protein